MLTFAEVLVHGHDGGGVQQMKFDEEKVQLAIVLLIGSLPGYHRADHVTVHPLSFTHAIGQTAGPVSSGSSGQCKSVTVMLLM